jgi:hypothetical protein
VSFLLSVETEPPIMPSIFRLSDVILSVVLLSAVMLNNVMQQTSILNVVMLTIVMLNVMMLNIFARAGERTWDLFVFTFI